MLNESGAVDPFLLDPLNGVPTFSWCKPKIIDGIEVHRVLCKPSQPFSPS